ncbi:MAG TPA: hypothetical protein VFI13_04305 [Gemmatimonadales bacterium]|nr:hypothetical protein [Gemmatimonadales bacterium]
MRQIPRAAVPFLTACTLGLAAPLAAQEAHPAWEWSFHGVALINGYFNDNKVNNTDLPTSVLAPDGVPVHLPVRSLGASVRQTRLTGMADLAGFAGGDLHTELDVDFYGGQLGFGRTAPLPHIRRLVAAVQWQRWSVMAGQEAPLVSGQNPVSLATLGIPGYTAAGNLWLWIPQVRGGYELTMTGKVRFGLDAAALAPTAGGSQAPGIFTTPDRAEQSGRPMLEGRLRARWGQKGEIGLGGHAGWIATTGDSLLTSKAVTVDGIVPLGRSVDLRGEWFSGQGLAMLGGGEIGQLLDAGGAPLKGSGGWGQLLVRTGTHWELGAGYGFDLPKGTSADGANTAFKEKNEQYGGQVAWRLAPVVVAFEYRHLATTYGGGIGERTATHLNLAMGVEF